jgi:hypothetical protein
MTCDVSDVDAFVECQVPASIPLYRLVHFQIERGAREADALPPHCAMARFSPLFIASARIAPSTGTPHGYALRLLVEPTRTASPAISVVRTR